MKYIIIALLIQYKINAQCEVKVDEFTKNRNTSSKYERLSRLKGEYCYLETKFYDYNGYKNLVLHSEYPDIVTLREGEIIYIKFVDSTVLELKVQKSVVSDYTKSSPLIWYHFTTITLDDEDLTLLRLKPILKIRISQYDYSVKKDNQDVLIKQIKCVEDALVKSAK